MARVALSSDEIAAFRARATAAATHLFADKGYDAVTMRAVAAALGVSAMTPYGYLSGKEELFALVRTAAFRRFADRLEDALARGVRGDRSGPKDDPLARLARLKQAYVRFALDEPDAYRIMFELRQPDGTPPAELRREAARSFACLHRTVAEAVAARQLNGDPLTIAHLLWASTHGLVSLHLAGQLGPGISVMRLASIEHELEGFRSRGGRSAKGKKETS